MTHVKLEAGEAYAANVFSTILFAVISVAVENIYPVHNDLAKIAGEQCF